MTPSGHTPASLSEKLDALARIHSSRSSLPAGLPLDAKWEQLLLSEPKKLFRADGSINLGHLQLQAAADTGVSVA